MKLLVLGQKGPIYLKAASRNGTSDFKQASTTSYFFFQRKLSQSFSEVFLISCPYYRFQKSDTYIFHNFGFLGFMMTETVFES